MNKCCDIRFTVAKAYAARFRKHHSSKWFPNDGGLQLVHCPCGRVCTPKTSRYRYQAVCPCLDHDHRRYGPHTDCPCSGCIQHGGEASCCEHSARCSSKDLPLFPDHDTSTCTPPDVTRSASQTSSLPSLNGVSNAIPPNLPTSFPDPFQMRRPAFPVLPLKDLAAIASSPSTPSKINVLGTVRLFKKNPISGPYALYNFSFGVSTQI